MIGDIWETWQIWTASALGLLILEVFMPGFVLACIGIGFFGGALAAWLGLVFEWQLIIAGVTSLLAFLFLRPAMLKMGFSGNETLSGADAIIGKEVVVTQDFDEQTGLGRCKIDGDDWRAKYSDSHTGERAGLGQVLLIESVDSNTLIVRAKP
ncbi:NfeD family protein [Flavobacteriales bacterium]|jgi:membrane protein implicated in regulation of membrane protease activity|nr:NfeD family protein [Crocinitomicaceae bacterium]MDA7743351.1 NfeD family protein [Flavobacteriales bacterium]MDB4493557.1 NfeD family protein [Flavobacteriales bacterium]